MAPDNFLSTGCLRNEKHRHSPRIFNKNATKLDISTVNNKIDFMRSLNLFCFNHKKSSEESHANVNWEIFQPRNSLPLKECSVLINCAECNVCRQPLRSKADVDHHKHLHRTLTINSDVNNDILTDSNKIGYCKQDTEQNCFECYNNNNNNNNNNNYNESDSLKNTDKMRSYKRHTHKKRTKNAVTKVTLKIGGEIISKVYCKKKYLNQVCYNYNTSTGVHHHDNCKNCKEIKEILHNNKVPLSFTKDSNTEQVDRNLSRLRKMAAALVEQELRRKALQSLERSSSFTDDDAVVPDVSKQPVNSDNVQDDDIQEVLQITKNDVQANQISTNNQSSVPLQIQKNSLMKDCEIITIDDENCDDFEDCIIVDERICQKNDFGSDENSYILHVSNNDTENTQTFEMEDSQIISKKRKALLNNVIEDVSLFKKSRMDNKLNFQLHCSKTLSNTCEIEKENNIYQTPTIKLSQFALPLRLINF